MKRKLLDIAKDYGIEWEVALKMASENLEEEMLTGKGKLLWVSELGQSILDELVPMPRLLRGKVLQHNCPNSNYVYVKCAELIEKRVPVKISKGYKFGDKRSKQEKMKGKMIYFVENRIDGEVKYIYQKNPINS